MATASFLASRASPTAGFWLALAGGVALARAGQRRGPRVGYGASIAATVQTVAIMGPARFGVPFTQALSAPLLGHLEARGKTALQQVLACATIRLVQTGLFVAFFAVVLSGGLDTYTDTYDSLARRVPVLPQGTEAALIVSGSALVLWAAFASTVQVLVYRRGLRLWPAEATATAEPQVPESPARGRLRFDPRAIAIAAAIAFCILLVSTKWLVLAGVGLWLAAAWLSAGADNDVLPTGGLIAAVFALGVLGFTLAGGLGLQLALRRAARAGLLVLVATWLRAAAGAAGLRDLSRRALGRLRRVPATREAELVLQDLGSGRQLGSAARSAADALRPVPKRPIPVLDAVLSWVPAESARFRAASPAAPLELAAHVQDVVLVVLAAAPAVLLLFA